jgi:hypothetical protein
MNRGYAPEQGEPDGLGPKATRRFKSANARSASNGPVTAAPAVFGLVRLRGGDPDGDQAVLAVRQAAEHEAVGRRTLRVCPS